jgi:protein-tyrosine phosphatase
MKWAYNRDTDELEIIHIRDWHSTSEDNQKAHLHQFGDHCLAGSSGADFVFNAIVSDRSVKIINASGLNDFIDTDLNELLEKHRNEPVKVGIIGVWTEAKISFLAYEIISRFPEFEVAVCSALTASSSIHSHHAALDHLRKILGVNVFNSVGEFSGFLSQHGQDYYMPIEVKSEYPKLNFSDNKVTNIADLQVIKYLFRGSKEVKLKVLDGGFSGNLVLGTESNDLEGRKEVPHVVKIGDQEPIGQERRAFEKVEQVLGNNAPRITDFVDYKGRGGIKYRYASMGKGKSKSFQKIYSESVSLEKIEKFIKVIFEDQLGRLYASKTFEHTNLLSYYLFRPSLADNVKKLVESVYGKTADQRVLEISSFNCPNPYFFYSEDLEKLLPLANSSCFQAYIHGDLNGANIIIDSHENVWIIDFFHTHRGHILKDLIKLENDLLYIFTEINNDDDLAEAIKFSNILFDIHDLAKPLAPVKETGIKKPQFVRAYETIKVLRALYHSLIEFDRNPLQVFIGQLRYSIHTLSFYESNKYQKLWALYNSGHFCRIINERIRSTGPLRIDWLKTKEENLNRIGLTILPGRKDFSRSIDADIQTIKNERISKIIVLVTDDELHDYGVDELLTEYEKAGLEYHHMPILDQMVCSKKDMDKLVWTLNIWLEHGNKIMVHCVGGLGRSGMVAACYLKHYGINTKDAIAIVRDSRSTRAIESKLQEEFVEKY